VAPEHHMDSMF